MPMCTGERDAKKWIVITSINHPTETVKKIASICARSNEWSAVVVGDKKTPKDWSVDGVVYLDVDRQRKMFGELCELIPYNHYCRKNLGYLYAVKRGAECILETDDDNIPYEKFGHDISQCVSGRLVGDAVWVNIYRYFTESFVWPRGLPLSEIRSEGKVLGAVREEYCPVQQFLADEDPDVDAIYRMIIGRDVIFDRRDPAVLAQGVWVPFNSQNTIFFKDVFPLMYLPCFVSFRVTDIWRSFVAQAALWCFDYRLAFLPSTVRQSRNVHDLMKDFSDEYSGYVGNERLAHVLSGASSRMAGEPGGRMSSVVEHLWGSLLDAGFVTEREMYVLRKWLDELDK